MNEWNIQSALFGTVEWTTPSRLPPKWFELNCDFLLKLLLQLSTGRFFAMIEHLRRTWLEIIFHRQHSEEEEEGCWTKVIHDSLFVQRASFFDSKTTLPVNCVLGYPDSCCWPHSCPVLYSSCCSIVFLISCRWILFLSLDRGQETVRTIIKFMIKADVPLILWNGD